MLPNLNPLIIAALIREGLNRLRDKPPPNRLIILDDSPEHVPEPLPDPPITIEEMISLGESQELEFKSSGRWNLYTDLHDPKMEHVLVKTVCGFLNAEGGTLLVGVSDEGEVLGLTKDYTTLSKKPNRDGYELWLRQHLDNSLSGPTAGIVHIGFVRIRGHEVCTVRVGKAHKPVFAKPLSGGSIATDFWVRVGNATKQLFGEDMIDYQERHWQ